MNLSSLAKSLMQRTAVIAGDGARSLTIHRVLGIPVYSATTGLSDVQTVDKIVKRAFPARFSDSEIRKYGFQTNDRKLTIPRLQLGAFMPDTDDNVTYQGEKWEIVAVWEDALDSSVVIAIRNQ